MHHLPVVHVKVGAYGRFERDWWIALTNLRSTNRLSLETVSETHDLAHGTKFIINICNRYPKFPSAASPISPLARFC